MDKPDKTGIRGRLVGVEPENEAEHFEVCPICNRAFDARDLDEVTRHADPDHTAEKLDS